MQVMRDGVHNSNEEEINLSPGERRLCIKVV